MLRNSFSMAEVVVVELRADASNLVKGFQQAENSAKGFGSTIKKGTTTAKDALNKTNTNLTKTTSTVQKSGGAFSKLGSTLKSAFLPMVAGVAIIGKLKAAFTNALKIIREFDKATAELSAITGATGKDLDFLTDKAIELGPSFGKGATEVVNAFKLVGSARPELLKNGEALAEVTKQALTLSQATGDSLESSVGSLTSTLNQFGIAADDADDAINTLAAGSKAGAAPVDQISASLVGFGAVANQTNVSLEESVGLIEVLADKSITGSEAGNKLRNVLTILSTADALPKEALGELEKFGVDLDVVTNNALPLNERLTEFSKIANDGTALVKVFGRENQVAGSIILNNVDRFDELTNAVTGTNVAFEQAEIASKTLAFQNEKTEAVYESMILSIDEGNGPISEAAVNYEVLQQEIFSLITVLNDAKATNEQLVDSFINTGIAISEFSGVGGSALSEADGILKGIEGTLQLYVDKTTEAAIAIQEQKAALGQLEEGYAPIEAALDTQAEKTKELLQQILLADGAERDRIGFELRQSEKVLAAIQSEADARAKAAQSALLGAAGPSAGQIAEINALAEVEEEAEKKAGDKKKADREKLNQELRELRIRVLKEGLDEELALLDLAFEEEVEKFKGNAEGIKLLEQQLAQDKEAITQEFRQKEAEQRQNTLKDIEANRREAFELEQEAIQRSADEKKLIATTEEALAKDLADAEVQIEIEKLTTLIELRKAAGEDTLSLEQDLANIRRDIRQEEIEAERELEAQRAEAREEVQRGAQELFFTLLEEQTQRKLEASEAETNRELALIDAQLKSETISQAKRESLEKQRQAIEEKGVEQAKQIERDAAQRDLAIANFEALINGAVAITKALSIDPTGVLAASVAAQTAIQLALINAEQIPAFAEGVSIVTGGTPGKDSVLANLMPGERVVTTANNKKHWDPLEAMRNGNYEQFVWDNDVAPALRKAQSEHDRREAVSRAKELAEHTFQLNNSGAKFNDRNIVQANKEGNKVLYGIYDQLESLNKPESGLKRKM